MVRIRCSVWLVSGYAHVSVQLCVVVVAPPFYLSLLKHVKSYLDRLLSVSICFYQVRTGPTSCLAFAR